MDYKEKTKEQLIERIDELEILNQQLQKKKSRRQSWNMTGQAIWVTGTGISKPIMLHSIP